MKKGYLVAGVALLSLAALQGCSNSSSAKTEGTTYSYVFVEDPTTLDYTVSGRHGTSQITTQGVDGLLENDQYGNLIPSLAKDWKVSSDGLTYTYTLRKGVKWYTSDGEEYAEVTADDFVTGLKHAADKKSSTLYIVQDSIKGLNDYVEGTTKDFSEVGIKAVDKYTVQYTLNQPESYWNSKTTYGILQLVNADFLKSQGDDFGSVDPSSILYNGAFILKSITSKSSIEFNKNENYWDADKVKLEAVKLTYDDGSDPESLYRNFDKGNYSRAILYPTKSGYKDIKKKYKDEIYYEPQDQSTYYVSFNLNRKAYEFTSKENDSQKTDIHKAILNKDFRQAITFAFDRAAWNSQAVGEEASTKALRNLFVPPAFVSTNGTEFGDLVTEELASNSTWSDVDFSDAQDGLYNVDKAKASFEKAKAALEAEGVQFPIHLDIAAEQTDEISSQRVSSLKQYIHQNIITMNLGVSYPSYANLPILQVIGQGQGKTEAREVTFPTGKTKMSSIDIYSRTYKSPKKADAMAIDNFGKGDAYTATRNRYSDPSMVSNSVRIGIIGVIISYAFGLPIGLLMARFKNGFFDRFSTGVTTFLLALPSIAIIYAIRFIGSALGLPDSFPALGAHDWRSYALPAFILGFLSIPGTVVWFRRYVVDLQNSDFVRFARAKGLSENEISRKHLFKQAMVPIVNGIPEAILGTIVGATLTETIFAFPGMGKMLIESIKATNNAMVVGLVFLFTSLSVISLLLGDLLMVILDPRIKLASKGGKR